MTFMRAESNDPMIGEQPTSGADLDLSNIEAAGLGADAAPAHVSWVRTVLVRVLGIGLFLAVVIVYFSVASRNFLTLSNSANILSGIAVLGIVAIGQTAVIVSGGFDLSVAGVLPMACVAFVKISNGGANLIAALFATAALGAAVGVVNATLVTRARINPLIVTLASMSITGGIAYSLSNGTTIALNRIQNGDLATLAVGQLPWYFFVFLLVAVVFAFVMRFTVFGRAVYALGGSREASVLAGIRVDLVSTTVYALSGTMAAMAGVVTASQILAGSAGVGSDTALMSVAAVVLGGAALSGGTGGIVGTIGGVLVLGCLSNGLALMHVQSFYVQIITGAALLVAVMFSRFSQMLTR